MAGSSAGRHVGDFLDRREAFLHQDLRDVLVDVELLHEQLEQRALLGLALRLGGLLAS